MASQKREKSILGNLGDRSLRNPTGGQTIGEIILLFFKIDVLD